MFILMKLGMPFIFLFVVALIAIKVFKKLNFEEKIEDYKEEIKKADILEDFEANNKDYKTKVNKVSKFKKQQIGEN